MSRIPLTLLILLSSVCVECFAQTAPPQTWDLGNGLKGTPEQIAKALNDPVESAWAHQQASQAKVKADEADIDKTTKSILAQVQAGDDYKTTTTTMTTAKAALDNARAAGNNAGALDAGSTYNSARLKLASLEPAALKGSAVLKSDNAALAQDRQQLDAAQNAFNSAAESRCKAIRLIKSAVDGRNYEPLLKQIDSINGPPATVLDKVDLKVAADAFAEAANVQQQLGAAKAKAVEDKRQEQISAGKLLKGMSKNDAEATIQAVAKGFSNDTRVTDGETVTDADGIQRCERMIFTPIAPDGWYLRETFTIWFDKDGKVKDFNDVKEP
jgi:hypothetical protein